VRTVRVRVSRGGTGAAGSAGPVERHRKGRSEP